MPTQGLGDLFTSCVELQLTKTICYSIHYDILLYEHIVKQLQVS